MAKSQNAFIKHEKEKKRLKKREEKAKKKEERKANSQGSDLDSMMAFVDEFGNITDTPPDETKKQEIDAESIEIGIARQTAQDDEPLTGKVEFFDDTKGFGFIKGKRNNEKYFVHVKGLIDKIKENDTVTFELEQGLKGLNAVRVKKI